LGKKSIRSWPFAGFRDFLLQALPKGHLYSIIVSRAPLKGFRIRFENVGVGARDGLVQGHPGIHKQPAVLAPLFGELEVVGQDLFGQPDTDPDRVCLIQHGILLAGWIMETTDDKSIGRQFVPYAAQHTLVVQLADQHRRLDIPDRLKDPGGAKVLGVKP